MKRILAFLLLACTASVGAWTEQTPTLDEVATAGSNTTAVLTVGGLTTSGSVTANRGLHTLSDVYGVYFGAGDDAHMYSDGTDLFVSTSALTLLEFTGFAAYNFDSNVSLGTDDILCLGGGLDACLTWDGDSLNIYSATSDTDNLEVSGFSYVYYTTGVEQVIHMDDAAGTNAGWIEWGIGGAQDVSDNWRIGMYSSNLVVQVHQGGGWTNATVFARP